MKPFSAPQKTSSCASTWDRRFRLSTWRAQRFFHTILESGCRRLDWLFPDRRLLRQCEQIGRQVLQVLG
jgi:hypothetical protein